MRTGNKIMKNLIEMKKILTIAALLSTSMNLAWATGKGESGAQFLRIGAGARALGMAGAFSPVADDATAIYWNPAGMASVEKREVSLTYDSYFKDSASQYLGYAHPMGEKGTLGLGVSMFSVRNIDKRSATGGDADSPDMGTFNTQDLSVSIGWANKMGLGSGRLNYGVAGKFIRSDLGTSNAATGALDMGTMYKFSEDSGFNLSLAVLNLGGQLKFNSEGDPLPLSVRPGMAWTGNVGSMGKLIAAVDADMEIHDGKTFIEPGVEWQIHPAIALRTGYQFGRDTGAGSAYSVGMGFNVSNLKIDYAFVPYGDLGDTHRISLGYKF